MENDFMMTESLRTINHKLNDLLSKSKSIFPGRRCRNHTKATLG